ncbi:MAG: hypothetical protein JW953_18255 [Anaerolineae bacterium]|nr:hypothetical protein [Anaerolineae bacterium]
MPETIGTLNLKIARLTSQLQVLEQQQRLSSLYPDHQSKLIREDLKVRFQLQQLLTCRAEILQRVSGYMSERLFDGSGQREQSFSSAY